MAVESVGHVIINNIKMRYFTTGPAYTDLSPNELVCVNVSGVVRLVKRCGTIMRGCVMTPG